MIINMQISSVGENSYYESVSVKANKAEETSFELKGNEKKEKIDYFKDICRRYLGASFYVEDGIEHSSYDYAGISDTKNFGDPGVRSYSISEEILEKMQDPEYVKRLYGVLDFMESDSEYKRHISHSDKKYKYIMIEDTNGMAVNQFYCSIMGSSSPMNYIKSANEEGKREGSIFNHEAMLKKISYFAEERYCRLVNGLFSDDGNKNEHDKHRDNED